MNAETQKPHPRKYTASDADLKKIRNALERGEIDYIQKLGPQIEQFVTWRDRMKANLRDSVFFRTEATVVDRRHPEDRFTAINLQARNGIAFTLGKRVQRISIGNDVEVIEKPVIKIIGLFAVTADELKLAEGEKARQKEFGRMLQE